MIVIKREVDPEVTEGFNPIFSKLPYNSKLEDFVFFDIETTGFDPLFSRYTMSGMFYFMDNKWFVEQYMTESREDEEMVLIETNNALMYFKHIVTYNGDRFDLPYLITKFKKIGLDGDYLLSRSLDLYPLTKNIRDKYNFINCRLETVEKHLGINRKYFIEGESLAQYYMRAIEGSKEHYEEYVGYNQEDVIYLAQIMSNLAEDYFGNKEFDSESAGEQLTIFDL